MTLDDREPLDPNTADAEALCLLPGLGLVLAERLIAARPFETLQDLTRVRGIGAASVERWQSLLALSSSAVEPQSELEPLSTKVEPGAAPGGPDESAAEEREPELPEQTPEGEPLALPKVKPGTAPDGPAETPAQAEEMSIPPEVVPSETAERPRPAVTRRYVGCMVVASGLLVLVLSLALSLGILARLNDNQLQFASPAETKALDLRIEGLETRAEDLGRELDGLRTRLSNVEAIGERMQAAEQAIEALRVDVDALDERLGSAEQTTEALQTDVDATAAQVAELSAQVDTVENELKAVSGQLKDLRTTLETLQAQSGRFETFLEGLQALMESLFQAQGGQ
jgi:hypothetical protein